MARRSGRRPKKTPASRAEELRRAAERKRVEAERDRLGAETTRKAGESARSSAEDARGAAEFERRGLEEMRRTLDEARRVSEMLRRKAEEGRVSAERTRRKDADRFQQEMRDGLREQLEIANEMRASAQSFGAEWPVARQEDRRRSERPVRRKRR